MRRGLACAATAWLRFAVPAVGALAVGVVGCEAAFGPSKVAKGEKYEAGDARFDGFFDAVHKEQLAAAEWKDDRTNARKTLLILAGVTSTASDDVLVKATRERAKGLGGEGAHLDLPQAKVILAPGAKDDPQLLAAVTETTRRELDRARKLTLAIEKLEPLEKQGEELHREAAEDVKNAGVDKADEKKMERKREIKRELGAAVSVLADLEKDAKRQVHDAERFLDALDAALQNKERVAHGERVFPPPAAPSTEDKLDPPAKTEGAKPKGKPGKPAPPKAEKKGPASAEPKAAPPPKKGDDEVFTP